MVSLRLTSGWVVERYFSLLAQYGNTFTMAQVPAMVVNEQQTEWGVQLLHVESAYDY